MKREQYDGKLYLIKALNEKGLYKHANQAAELLKKKISSQTAYDLNSNMALKKLSHLQYYSNNPIKYTQGESLLESLVSNFNQWTNIQSQLYKVK